MGASLVVQLVKNPPAMQETQVQVAGWKIPWRRDRLPTPVFLGFLGGSAGKESTRNVGDLDLICHILSILLLLLLSCFSRV